MPVAPVELARAPSDEDADLSVSTAFGGPLGAMPRELFAKIVPAERTVMLRKVSRGAQSALASAQPAAVVKAKGGARGLWAWE